MTDYFEHIDEYMNNQLSEKERRAFENELLINPKLKSHVDRYEMAIEISLGSIDAEVKSIASQVEKEQKEGNFRKWIWAAASVIFLSTVGYFYFGEKLTKKPIMYADIYMDPAWPINRSNDRDTLSDAIKIALDGNIQAAFIMIKRTSMTEQDKNIWIAEIFAKQSMADSTLYYLPRESNDRYKRDRITYLRIISLYKLERIEEVKKLIQALPEDTDSRYIKIYDQIAK